MILLICLGMDWKLEILAFINLIELTCAYQLKISNFIFPFFWAYLWLPGHFLMKIRDDLFWWIRKLYWFCISLTSPVFTSLCSFLAKFNRSSCSWTLCLIENCSELTWHEPVFLIRFDESWLWSFLSLGWV